MRLDIGCGPKVCEGYVGVDFRDYGQEHVLDVREGLPFLDNDIEAIRAAHFIEHLTQDEAAAFLNECWRILRPGGELMVVTPHAQRREKAFLFGHRSYYTEATFLDIVEHDYWETHGIRQWAEVRIITNRRGDIHCRLYK